MKHPDEPPASVQLVQHYINKTSRKRKHSGSDSTDEEEREDVEVSAEDEVVNSTDSAPPIESRTDISEEEFQEDFPEFQDEFQDDEDDFNPRHGYEVDRWSNTE